MLYYLPVLNFPSSFVPETVCNTKPSSASKFTFSCKRGARCFAAARHGYLRASRTAVDGLAGMCPETQLQALADAGVQPANVYQDVGISGSVPVGDRPGWTELDTKLRRGDTVTVAALDRLSCNCVDLVGVVESLHRRGVYLASLV